ncbi:MFS transporter [Parafrankia elaeagni]|uniref:MFS transporter n=1 Tax=Parafrankia elaeagni TaxID=222534 RepID=UPI00039BC321|nr:MFS transporter [Parafrankia elaeagni]
MRPGTYRLTFGVVMAGTAAFALLQSLVGPVLPTIQRELHTDQNTVTWVMTSYLLAASVATPILGRVGDMIGKKKVFVFALLLLGLGALVSALATGIGLMIVGRVIQGCGGAILPLSFGILRDELPPEKLGSAVGIVAALTAVGGGVGLVLAGPIESAFGYHWLFWAPMIVILLAAAAAAKFVPESRNRRPARVSWFGGVLLAGWLIALLLGVSEGRNWGWTSPEVLGLFAAALVLGALWLIAEDRAREPLIDLRMMRLRPVWTANLVALLFGMGLYGTMSFLPAFLQTPTSTGYGLGASVTESGLYALPMTLTMFLVSMVSGRVTAVVGSRVAVVGGSLLSVLPLVMFAYVNDHAWQIVLASSLFGVGMGLVFAAMANIVVESVPATQTAVASGMNANIRTIGGSIGAAVMAVLVAGGASAGGLPQASGYSHGFLFLAVASAVAALVALLIPRVRNETVILRRSGAHEHPETALVAGAELVD